MEEKNITGYPHIDMPWLKYYDKEKKELNLPKKTIFQNMKDNISNYLDNTAITYNGIRINYNDFLKNVDISAKILTAIGVKNNDRVLYLVANTPESAYTLYGTNMIGAVSDYVDPRPDSFDFKVSAQKVFETIKREKIKHIVTLDQCYLAMIKPIENQLKDYGISKVILISPSDSLNTKGQLNYIEELIKFEGLSAALRKLKYLKKVSEQLKLAVDTSVLDIISYSDMIKNVNTIKYDLVDYVPNKLTAITHSSGTSGTFPKTIPLTNEGIISYGFQLSRSNVNTSVGDSSLQILPYFSAYGLGIANFGYSNADNMIQVPEFSPNNLGKMIVKYKPNVLIGTPNWYLSMPNDEVLKNVDLSFIKTIGYGGDSMNAYDEQKVNKFLKEHNCNEKITKGHGMSEISGGASYAIGEYNIPGSMGIPMIDTIYGIVNPETKELIKFNDGEEQISGEFIVSSPAIVSEKIDDRDVIKHGKYDGIDFIYTGDIGTMDRNGILYFLSRNDRTFTRFDGFKVKPYEIENVIKSLDIVKDCVITPYNDEEKYGKMITANIILNESIKELNMSNEKIINDILQKGFIQNPNVSSRQIPTRIIFMEEYPLTKNNKVDYKSLEKYDDNDDIYNIVFDETSISIGNIQIIKNKNKKLIKSLI